MREKEEKKRDQLKRYLSFPDEIKWHFFTAKKREVTQAVKWNERKGEHTTANWTPTLDNLSFSQADDWIETVWLLGSDRQEKMNEHRSVSRLQCKEKERKKQFRKQTQNSTLCGHHTIPGNPAVIQAHLNLTYSLLKLTPTLDPESEMKSSRKNKRRKG